MNQIRAILQVNLALLVRFLRLKAIISEQEYDSSIVEPFHFEPLASEGSDSNEKKSDDRDNNLDRFHNRGRLVKRATKLCITVTLSLLQRMQRSYVQFTTRFIFGGHMHIIRLIAK